MTINEAISALELRLGQDESNPKISRRQMQYELDAARAMLVHDYLRENGYDIHDDMVTWLDCQTYVKEDSECDDCTEKYLTLPGNVMDLPDEMGVFALLRPGGFAVTRIGGSGARALQKRSRYSVKEGWWKKGDKIMLQGSFPADTQFSAGLVLSRTNTLSSTVAYPMPEYLMAKALDMTEQVLRRQLTEGIVRFSDGDEQSE